eukprot:scaffold88497_cov56-Attheya_sp.AAC.2
MAAALLVVLPPVLDPFGQDTVERSLQICGCSLALRNSIISEGVTTMDALRHLNNRSLDNIAKGACEQQKSKPSYGLTDPLLGYECSFWGLSETRDGQIK